MVGSEPREDDRFPPERPFGAPAQPASPETDKDDDTGAPRPAPGPAGRDQPPATPS